ncbi:MAG TPA: hypothetical protein VK842_07735 [bacterium]|jgi:hypothetical protein|nr:hypothetical protein [bacterium]
MSTQILESVIYRPKAGVDPALTLAKVESVLDPFLRAQPGMERAWRGRTEDGAFMDAVLWKDEAAFRAAVQAERAHPGLGPVFALFEEASLVMRHGRVFEGEAQAHGGPILDCIVYRPKDSVGAELALAGLRRELDPFLRAQPGLEGAWRGACPDGSFVATVLWKDEASFRAFEAASRQRPGIGQAFGNFDEASLVVKHSRIFD